MGVAPGADARARLEGFVRSFLHRVLDDGRPAWHGKLMAMEIADPTPALDLLVSQSIRPMYEELARILRELLGPGASQDDLERCAGSIIGQCLHYKHARPVIERLGLWRVHGAEDVAAIADHIVMFSLGGIARLSERQTSA